MPSVGSHWIFETGTPLRCDTGDAGVAPCKVGMELIPESPLGPPRPLRRPGDSDGPTRPPDSVEVCHGRFHKAGARRPVGAWLHCPIHVLARRSAMFLGIAVGAKHLEAAATPPVASLPARVPNTTEGIATLMAALTGLTPQLIVLEATGTYHQPLLAALLLAKLPIAVVNPAQIAAFRTTRLGRHKTDRADARLLARFAALHHAELRHATPDEPDLARLRALVGYRDDLVAPRTRLRNQRHAAHWAEAATVGAWLDR